MKISPPHTLPWDEAAALKLHPLAQLMPPMTATELDSLRASIVEDGQQDPVVLYQGQILDGRHRRQIAVDEHLDLAVATFSGDEADAVAYVRAKATHRYPSESQRACAAVQVKRRIAKDRVRDRVALVPPDGESTPVQGKSRDRAAELFGVSPRYVQYAEELFKADKKLFREAFEGRVTISQARVEVRRRDNARKLKAVEGWESGDEGLWDVLHGDCRDPEVWGQLLDRFGRPRLIITDPPYNIGIDYGDGAKADKLSIEDYGTLLESLLKHAYDRLADDGSMWVLLPDEWIAQFVVMATVWGSSRTQFGVRNWHLRNWIIWHETFGVQTSGKFARCKRHFVHLTKHKTHHVWHESEVLEPSARAEKYGDKRAQPGGKTMTDVWTISRLTATHPERVSGFPTQVPVELFRRAVVACSDPGDLVIDPFNGSGTAGVAALLNKRRYCGIELSPDFAKKSRARIRRALAEQLDQLDKDSKGGDQ